MGNPIQAEFSRQAGPMSTAGAFRAPAAVERVVRAIRSTSPGRVLDLACGPGIVAEAIAPWVGALVGVDGTLEMVRLARARCAAKGLSNSHFQAAWAENLPFRDAAVDAVVTRLSFHHFSDLPAVLAEVRRVLRPGGDLVVADVTCAEDPGDAALHNALERLRDPTHVRMLAPSQLREALRRGGFAIQAEETWSQQRAFPE
ncbi:MAG: class I SAM-dependent methyltransferase, partial [Proteobacteria bacterium]|nr:class I SAM-dependent methyltransferase [Pseudomonadota bacterium]